MTEKELNKTIAGLEWLIDSVEARPDLPPHVKHTILKEARTILGRQRRVAQLLRTRKP